MLGERLAEIRREYGDTQQTLAEKLNVTKYTISNWEQGKSEPSHELVVKLCRLYQVSADYLLGVTDDDAVYRQRKRETQLSKESQTELAQFERYLLWKQGAAKK